MSMYLMQVVAYYQVESDVVRALMKASGGSEGTARAVIDAAIRRGVLERVRCRCQQSGSQQPTIT